MFLVLTGVWNSWPLAGWRLSAPVGGFDKVERVKASAWGLATIHESGQLLEVFYPYPTLGESPEQAPEELVALVRDDAVRRVRSEVVFTEIETDDAPVDTADAYLRLQLLSHRLMLPRSINLDGIFGALPNVVWTSSGPCAVEDFDSVRLALRAEFGQITVFGVDKFPRMVDYVIPSGVRIADADRVRLGAYLSEGTTVMHEGFVNFNAGTLGTAMVEGRISQGVIVGNGTDIGGGASIMGTLSGGGKAQISIGEGCLLGAESGLGISLGDNCVIEAGLYVTAGSRVTLPDGQVVKASELSGASNILFIRDSTTGTVLAKPRTAQPIELNTALHAQ